MKIRDILRGKGVHVFTINGDRPIEDALRTMVEQNIGSLVVMDGEFLKGIITERDILRLTARASGQLGYIKVSAAMTRDLVTAGPEDGLHSVMELMTTHRVRHLPIVDGHRLVGIVSIGDLVQSCWMKAEQENAHLRDYIQYSR